MSKITILVLALIAGVIFGLPTKTSAQMVISPDLINQPVNCIIDDESQEIPEGLEGCGEQEPLNPEEPLAPEEPINDGRPDKGEVSSETVAGYEETAPQVLSASTEATTATLQETGSAPLLSLLVAAALAGSAIFIYALTKRKAVAECEKIQ